jgi:hypothetical protein
VKQFAGQTVVCIASGPSLTTTDLIDVELSGLPTIAINTTWEKARFCDIIYGGDLAWWRHNAKLIDIPAARWTCSKPAAQVHSLNYKSKKIKDGYNSGANAIELASSLGAAVILMLGYDCSVQNGTHHHPDHIGSQNPTETKCKQWRKHFDQLPRICAPTLIINCSRQTALKSFQLMTLADALCEHGSTSDTPQANAETAL